MAAAAAVIGALGTIGSMAQGAMPQGQGSMSTLSPQQLLMQAKSMKALMPLMKGHYGTLAELGQNTPNAYDQMPSFNEDYVNKIYNPQLERNRSNMEMLQDNVHGRSNDILMNRYKTESRLSGRSLKQNLMQQNANLKQMATEDAAQRQLSALGGMFGQFGSVMGQNQENWMRQNPTSLEYATTGVAGAQSLYQAGKNIYDLARMSGAGMGTTAGASAGMAGAGGGF